jgi:glycosyltransferase involved in cell wall biosynthesis
MKILLIGPQPPPHGGISVHVAGIERRLTAAGVRCRVLDATKISKRLRFAITLLSFALRGWTLHLHTNGHNRNSWILAWLTGIAGRIGRGSVLTLHSGMAPQYISSATGMHRSFLAATCRLHRRIVCVAPEIATAVASLDMSGVSEHRIEVTPAFVGSQPASVTLDPQLAAWIEQHQPLLSTALFFRPEYGFDLLVNAIARLRERHPDVGCVVMGSGEDFQKARARVAEAGLEDHILLAGDVDHDTCLALMSASDVFVRPTLEDGDSISVREALELKVPVVASRVGTRPPGAILFHPGDVEDLLSKLESALAQRRQAA